MQRNKLTKISLVAQCNGDPSVFAMKVKHFVSLTNTSTAPSDDIHISRINYMLRQTSLQEDEATVNGKKTSFHSLLFQNTIEYNI